MLFGISIGYAAMNRTLNITGNSEVRENTWDIHFENVQIREGSVTATIAPEASGTTPTIGFSCQLDLPGDFYEFTVDVVNSGTIDAMIDSITKTPTLSASQAKYLNYIIEYLNGDEIASKQMLQNDSFVRLRVRVEYRTDLNAEDLPTIDETLNLGFTLNYVQADNKGVVVKNNGIIGSNGDINEIGTIVAIGTEKFYTIGTEGDNVKLLSMHNLHARNNESTYKFPSGGVTVFSNADKHGTINTDYNGSLVEEYVNTYADFLEDKFDVEIVEARLITKDELADGDTLGCSAEGYTCFNSPYSWIYSTAYWTETADSDYCVWIVGSDGYFGYDFYHDHDSYGVRPVIVISKSLFD